MPAFASPRSSPRVYDLSAFHPTVRPKDVFICTYPKSGTTWLGFLLAQILKVDPQETLDLKSFGKYVPDVNLQYTKRGSLAQYENFDDPRFFLCHATCDLKLPKVVYVLRDPRDASSIEQLARCRIMKSRGQNRRRYRKAARHVA